MRQRAIRRTGVLLVMVAMLSGVAAVVTAPAVSAAAPTCAGKPATIVGTNRSEVIEGSSKRDVIVALGGHDFIKGKGGGDIICAGAGDDTVIGAKGADKLYGGPGDDKLRGGAGVDTCVQGPGSGSMLKCELPVVTLESMCLGAGGTYSEQNNESVYNKICVVAHLSSADFDVFEAAYGSHCFDKEPGALGLITNTTARSVNCFGSFV